MAPGDFIPLFERNGKIEEVDKYVWAEAARQVARWRAQFGVTIPVSVNLSRVDVFDPQLESILDGILSQNGLEHDALKLEVTESAYIENADHVIQVVRSLRRKGYIVEMDDFGTGYSSLNMLSTMPIDVLKMDRTFIQNIENSEKDIQLVALMGAEEYYLLVAPGNREITSDDYSTFSGKKVGVNQGSVQAGFFRDWAEANGVRAELVEMTGTEEENITKLNRGEIDLYVAPAGFHDQKNAVPVCEIGASDLFFAVTASRPEILFELNNAMSRVRDENQYFNQTLYAKYLQTTRLNYYLSAEENAWLEAHGAIRVGYQDNYLAFCAKDPATGELTGALKDYLAVASDCLENAHLQFEPVCYPTAAAAMEALKRGEVDCVFPTNLTDYDGEVRGVFITQPLMRTDMSAVIRETDLKNFAKKERVTVAVNTDNPNYDMFLLDHFPDWRTIYYADTQACLKAVADGQADCLLVSNYRYNNIAKLCEKYRLTTWSTGVEMNYCFAVNRKDTVLYSILAKTTGVVPSSTVNAALTRYFTEDARISRIDLFRQNIGFAVIALGLVLAFLLLAHMVRTEKKARKNGRPTPVKEDFFLFDDLPLSYSVYRVTHAEHSELYDAVIIYVNRKYTEYGGLPPEEVVGHKVRELYPFIEEVWFRNIKRAALDNEVVEYDYEDPLSGKRFNVSARQILRPGYCSVTYTEA